MRSLISSKDLRKEEVLKILRRARDFKIGETETVEGDVVLLFLEPSTRTRISFEKACRNLGLRTYTVLGESSSITKGESFFDTLKTFEALGFSAIVFRVPFVVFPYEDLLEKVGLPLINAGDGTHQHPTQGLIDLFTLLERFDSIEGLKILYVGDIAHSRVFRSGAPLLRMFGAKVSVCGPRTLIPRDIHVFEVEYVFDSVDEGMEWADVVIWLRLQKERQKENFIPSERSYFEQFGLTKERHERLKSFFMHPGPVNREIDVDSALLYSEKSLILDQVKNGIPVRMAVLSWCME